MKKVVLASLLACAAIASGLPSAYAQTPVALGAAAGACQMPDAEYKPYNDAMSQTTAAAKAAAIEAYLTAFPQSCAKFDTLVVLMQTYYSVPDYPKTLDAADRVLQLDANNLPALVFEALIRKGSATSTDPAANQATLDAAAGFAQRGLVAPKPAAAKDEDFKKIQAVGMPIFYSAIGTAALNKKDTATAIDAFKKELASVPVAQTQAPGPVLQDTYYLGQAYLQSTPPDLLNCAFYVARFVAFAPEPYKSQYMPTAKYCYRKYHGKDDGYDAVVAAAQANLNPPDGFQASVTPAPTAADIVTSVIASTPDLGTLAVDDKEFILQNGTPDQAAKVWDTVKGKSVEIPGALVIASTPAQIQVAISGDAVQSKTADFTFNMTPPEELVEPKATATPAAKAAYKKKLADQTAMAAATAVGQTITLDGTYDSFTPKPIMITMINGSVVLPKAAAKPAAAPVHHTAPAHK
jgi:tetratricopeptide (TPR) repeat protein